MTATENKYSLEQKAEIVAEIRKHREKGLDFKEIAAELNKSKYKTLTGVPWKENNAQGFYYTFRKQLQSPTPTPSSYAGSSVVPKNLLNAIITDPSLSDFKKVELVKLLMSA